MNEIRNLNNTLSAKNSEIQFIIAADKKFIQDNEILQDGLKAHIKRLQDKIFLIQREFEIELFQTIDRLQNQYKENLDSYNKEFDKVRKSHLEEVDRLKEKNDALKR